MKTKKPAATKSVAKKKAAQTPKNGAPQSTLFPIVGIGASAGGVEAFSQLLNHLPLDTGMGFVLVQHLDSRHESALTEILGRASRMPVQWAEPNQPVEPNRVYVMPPGKDLDILEGRLQVHPRVMKRGVPLPVDRFLRSLAEDRGSLAIGVILSGTASDGTLGLKALKAGGGIAFAQSEGSARYSGMPDSAVAAGVVDYILPPEAIANELVRIGRHPLLYARDGEARLIPAESDGDLAKLFVMLRNATSVDFTHYKLTTIQRRIARRMVVCKMEKLKDYLHYVQHHPDELKALYHDLLIKVTGFFRDPATFRALKKTVFPKLLRKRGVDHPLRVWVAGCSTGEEAYSLAIALHDCLRELSSNIPVQVFATDISDSAIETARAGIYPENIVAELRPETLRRYFTAANGGFQVTRALRESCVFAKHNMVRDAPFSRLDLVSCRNVLIYLAPVLQKRAMNVFHYALKPSGYLVLGTSESVGTVSDLFSIVDKKNKIYSRKAGPARLNIDIQSMPSIAPAEMPRKSPAPSDANDLGREADRILLGRFSPAGVIVDESMKVVQFRGRTGRYLEPEPGDANLNLFRMVREDLLPAVRGAVQKAKKSHSPSHVDNVRARFNGDFMNVNVEVIPFHRAGVRSPHYLVLFEEQMSLHRHREPAPPVLEPESRQLRRVKKELEATKQYLQSIIEEQETNNEELKSANEEIQSSNEELQSTNEEMETAKEELQSTNEELTTVNEELNTRNGELAHLNNDLNNLLSSVQLPLVMVDSDLHLRRFTPAAEKLLNLIPGDIGRSLLDIKPNIDVPDLEQVLRDVIDNLRLLDREVVDRTGRAFSMWIRPYRTSENKIDGAVMAFVDISVLKHSLEQSRDLREYAEAIAATVREPFLALDSEFRVMTANLPFYSTFGANPQATEGVSLFKLSDGEWNIPRLRALLTEPGPQGFTQGIELKKSFANAGQKILSINLRRIPAQGAARMILLAIEDITARSFAEDALRLTQARFSAFTRDAPVGILQTDSRMQCTFANSPACRITGTYATDVLGRGWLKHIHPDDLTILKAKLERARNGRDGFSMEIRFLVTGDTPIWANLVLIPLGGGGESQQGFLIALTDISLRKDLEDRLYQAQKMEAIGRIAGGVAHDFNNMLTAISSYAALLLESVPEHHAARKSAVQIGHVAEQAALVTRQLLAFSRKQVMRPKRIDVSPVIRKMHDLLHRLLGESIEVHLDLAPRPCWVLVDPGQLQQLILNLAINARDAMVNGGTLTISTANVTLKDAEARREGLTPGGYVQISVGDTGLGMDAQTRMRLFEPFFTTKPPGAGTGLGLSMVYGIVRQSRGNIRVESELKKGTTLWIYLPTAAGAAPEAVESPHEIVAGGKETILVVEDAAVVRSLVRELLEERGYTVLEARDSQEAIAIAQNHDGKIDLLLTDLVMPRVGGHELARRITRRRKGVKVIYMSGYSGESLHAIEKEANFLEKPFTPDSLAVFVRQVLDHPKKP